MDPLSRLPLECLQHILQVLDHDDSLTTLANLLTMNKYIASVVLPYLYRDPYRLAFHEEKRGYDLQWYRTTTYESLTRMLLGRLPAVSLSKGLTLALTIDPAESSTPIAKSSLDYLAHIRHFSTPAQDSWEHHLLTTEMPLHQLSYIQSDEFDQIYQSQPFTPSYAAYYRTKEKLIQKYYRTVICLDALWCLPDPILEQLQSFTIPVRYIKRYRETVGRFRSLESIQFAMSQAFDEPFYSDTDAGIKRPHNDQVLQDMVQFVLEHLRIFKGQLKSIRCFDDGVWNWMDWKSIDRMELDFFRLLPPIDKPTHIGKNNWRRFSAHPQSTDVTQVQEFSSKAMHESWQDIIPNNQSILQRFRSLKRLDLSDFLAGTFDWAVQEKRELEWAGGIMTSDINQVGRGSLASGEAQLPAHRIHCLVPLERVYIKRQTVTCVNDIDDIAFAFSETLKRFWVSADLPLL
ncbi:hypothetical protein BGZ95_011041, partial [Linnemannia exigua]